MEHHATLDRLHYLKSKGFHVDLVKNDQNGQIDLENLKSLMKGDKALLSFVHANNETGVINPIKELTRIAHEHGHLVHIDGVQALGKIEVNLDDLDLDFASYSGHKIGSLKGVGLLYIKDIKTFKPLFHGGGQERGFRPGTYNFASIKSLGIALNGISPDSSIKIRKLKEMLEDQLKQLGSFIEINCFASERLPNTISVKMKGFNSREILMQLARKGICISTGSACSSGSFEPSHVMLALGYSKEQANSCFRISLGITNTEEDLRAFISVLTEILNAKN
jgi:cysteine desulfurase